VAAGDARLTALPRRPTPLARGWTTPAVAGLALLVLWEVGVRAKLPAFVPRPSGILAALPSVVTAPPFWSDALSTCAAIIEGMIIGTVAGAVLGLIMGRVREVYWLFSPLIRALYSMPLIALVPIMVLWLGYSETARLVTIAVAVFLPVSVTTSEGASAVPSQFLDVGRIFGARPHQVWFGIALPASLPQILAGMDIGMGRAMTNGVAVEVLASVAGLGYQLFAESQALRNQISFVYVIALAVFAIASRTGIRRLSHRLAPWYRPQTGRGLAA
jgi:ABC-type nitrate/sulfonate/bicarbonate transport system permease component